jgi:flagellar biosynthesis GTPase FlhF
VCCERKRKRKRKRREREKGKERKTESMRMNEQEIPEQMMRDNVPMTGKKNLFLTVFLETDMPKIRSMDFKPPNTA